MSALLLRFSGWFLLLGGLLMAVTALHLPISPIVTALFNLLGGVLLLLGLPALYRRQAKQVGWVGLVGLVIIWLDILIFPVLAGGIAGLVPAFKVPDVLFIIGPLTIIGTLLFGIMTMRAHVFPRWLGLCLFVSYILGVIGALFLDKSAPLIGLLGVLLFFLSFSAFGVVPLSLRSAQQERPENMIVARDASPADR